MTTLASQRKALVQRAAVVLMFLAVAIVAGTIVLRNHDAVVHGTKLDAATNAQIAAYVPPVKHVFVINIENKGFKSTWGDGIDGAGNGGDPYLAHDLRLKGNLLTQYYATAHNSLGNYIAQFSGQGPNPDIQLDCQVYRDITSTGVGSDGQVQGLTGCIFPRNTANIATKLQKSGTTWKGYMEGMKTPCQHPVVGSQDPTQKATATSEYAVRHNPFMYFHNIIDFPALCKAHVVELSNLAKDLRSYATTPRFSYITPDLCMDGHDSPCANGWPGGLKSIDVFMKVWVPRILNSPAFKQDGMLIITADESDSPQSDASSCCGEVAQNTPLAGITGSGGGLIGALVISKWTQPGSYSTVPYNHYAMLASIEEIFRVTKTGYAADPKLDRFGLDVYNSAWRS